MREGSIGRGVFGAWLAGAGALLCTHPALAGSMDLPFDIDGSYKITTTYSLAVRARDPLYCQALAAPPRHFAIIEGRSNSRFSI